MSVAKREMKYIQIEIDESMASLRREAKNNTVKKLTAKDLDDIVFSNEDIREKQKKLNDATFKYELLKGLVRSLEQKKDMLQQVSANKREEIKLYK
jgi:adenine C2-methylase RlmN of 23S rRNA A2503 and tRNA A37